MPSGNAIYTYTGPEESTEVQGQIFLKDQPKHITDQGVIAVCAAREDFKLSDIKAVKLTADEVAWAVEKLAGRVISESAPAKPKKAKSK